MKFDKVNNIILFGGSRLLLEFALFLKGSNKYNVTVFTCQRQLYEAVGQTGDTLQQLLDFNKIVYYISEDICKDARLYNILTENSLGIGFGEPWTFDRETINKFGGKLLDFMGIRLPQYRGGAHYSWQILRKNKIGCANLQVINEEMVQGEFDSGEIVKSKEYFFPATVRIPQDYFNEAVREELFFLKEFLKDIEEGKNFELTKLQENFCIYFPRLYTLKHGFVNWNWGTEDIVVFICAFDNPYKGASSFIGEEKVFLKNAYAEYNDGQFHPFQCGLIYKKIDRTIFVAGLDGTIVIKSVEDENSNDLMPILKVGQRLYTPQKYIEASMQYSALYNSDGLISK